MLYLSLFHSPAVGLAKPLQEGAADAAIHSETVLGVDCFSLHSLTVAINCGRITYFCCFLVEDKEKMIASFESFSLMNF